MRTALTKRIVAAAQPQMADDLVGQRSWTRRRLKAGSGDSVAMKDALNLRLRLQAVYCSLEHWVRVAGKCGEDILLWDDFHDHRNHRL
jgi:hypothetical protein